jgi:hypothetical protein
MKENEFKRGLRAPPSLHSIDVLLESDHYRWLDFTAYRLHSG